MGEVLSTTTCQLRDMPCMQGLRMMRNLRRLENSLLCVDVACLCTRARPLQGDWFVHFMDGAWEELSRRSSEVFPSSSFLNFRSLPLAGLPRE